MIRKAYIVGSKICSQYKAAKLTARKMFAENLSQNPNNHVIDHILRDYYKTVIFPANIVDNTEEYSKRNQIS